MLSKPRSSITQFETGQKLGAEEFQRAIELKAEELKSKYSIGPGFSVLILEHNSINLFVNLLAVFSLGGTVIPLDPLSSNLEIENIKAHAGVKLIIKENECASFNVPLTEELKNIALVLYTSGTTGKPKGVKISYQALEAKIKTLSEVISPDEAENILCFLPTFFGHGLICNSLFALFHSKNFFIAKKMDLLLASQLKAEINKFKISFFSSVPSVWEMILNFSEEKNSDSPSLKRVHCASSPLKEEKAMRIQEWLGPCAAFYNIFGITEMSGWFSHKKFIPGEDTNVFTEYWNAETKLTEEDELLIKAPYMFCGYLKNPEETNKAIDEQGFFKTGDIFKQHKYAGRVKLVINKKGMKIYPNEIDDFILSSGMVADCHTFAINEKYAGEIIGLLVVMKENHSLEQLRNFCQESLPPHKFPDRIFPVSQIERTSRGKIARESLEKYQGNQK